MSKEIYTDTAVTQEAAEELLRLYLLTVPTKDTVN